MGARRVPIRLHRLFTPIRELFAGAFGERGYGPTILLTSKADAESAGRRRIKVEMHLPDGVPCDVWAAALQLRHWRSSTSKNVHQILLMTAEQAHEFFAGAGQRKLQTARRSLAISRQRLPPRCPAARVKLSWSFQARPLPTKPPPPALPRHAAVQIHNCATKATPPIEHN